MPQPRPMSPHLGIYRWRINMVQSSLHRLTGLFLSAGVLCLTWAVIAAASGAAAWHAFAAFAASWPGLVLWLAWIWALMFHLINGIQHLAHSLALDYGPHEMRDRTRPPVYWRTGWIVVGVSSLLTLVLWACLLTRVLGGVA